jgi:hypothetical protein
LTDIRDQGFVPERVSMMESMGKKEPRSRRSFTPGFKAEVVGVGDGAFHLQRRTPTGS